MTRTVELNNTQNDKKPIPIIIREGTDKCSEETQRDSQRWEGGQGQPNVESNFHIIERSIIFLPRSRSFTKTNMTDIYSATNGIKEIDRKQWFTVLPNTGKWKKWLIQTPHKKLDLIWVQMLMQKSINTESTHRLKQPNAKENLSTAIVYKDNDFFSGHCWTMKCHHAILWDFFYPLSSLSH